MLRPRLAALRRAFLAPISILFPIATLATLAAQDAWQPVAAPGGPPPMTEHVAVFDSGRARTVLLASTGTGPAATYEFDGTNWSRRTTANAPTARGGAAMVYDSVRARTVLYGGAFTDEHWEYDGIDWQRRTFAVQPEARSWHAMAFDAARGRIVLFGGVPTCLCGVLLDTWEFDGTVWQPRVPVAMPQGRRGHVMAYDALRRRTVMYGGFLSSSWFQPPPGQFLDETFEWDGVDWREITATPRPPARLGAAFAFDSVRGVSVLFGGYCMPALFSGTAMNDTWEFGAAGWTQVAAATPPAARCGASLCFDAVRGRLLLFGGADEVAAPTQVFGDLHGMTSGPAGAASSFGVGCGTPVPTLTALALPRVGRTLVVECGGLPAQGSTFLVVGASRTSYGGVALPFDLGALGFPGCALHCSVDAVVPLPANGRFVAPTPDAFGASVHLQSLVVTATSFAATGGVTLTIGR